MAYPFLFLVLSLAGGIFTASFFSFPFLLSALILTGSLSWIFFLFFKKSRLTLATLLLTTFLLGMALYTEKNADFEQNSLYRLKAPSYADFTGTLYKSPSHSLDRDYYYLKVKSVNYQGKEERISGCLRISIPHSTESSLSNKLLVGDTVRVSARLTLPREYRNFDLTPRVSLSKINGIHNQAFAKSPLLAEKIRAGQPFSLRRFISLIRHKLLNKLEKHFPGPKNSAISPQGTVLEALLLGERGRLDRSVTRSFQISGLYHLLAISGAHIAIISYFFFLVTRLLRVPDRMSYGLLIGFLIFFAFLVEGRPSVIRAAFMTIAFLVGKLLWKDVNLINTLSISAFFLLLFNPFNLFSLGFQMTFAATLSILLFFPKIMRFMPNLPFKISEILALSVSAQLGILPFMAVAFNRMTFSSLILNLAAFPLVAIVMALGYVMLFLSFLSFSLAHLASTILKTAIDLWLYVSRLSDNVSFLTYRIPTPHLLTILGYSVFLLSFLLPLRKKALKALFFTGFIACFGILISYPFSSHSKHLKITFIDVGQGDSILVEFPGQEKMLVDGGGTGIGYFDTGEKIVSPFLWKRGIKTIDYLVLTHAHPDHLNGLISIARNFNVREFWETTTPKDTPKYTELVESLSHNHIHPKRAMGDSLSVAGINIEILHPRGRTEENMWLNDNNQSLVMRFVYGETSFLLTGDIEREAEASILNQSKPIQSLVLKAPHHGSNTSSSMEFLQKVSPKIIVITIASHNRYGFPDPEPLKRYTQLGTTLYRTDIHGAIEFISNGRNVLVRTATGEKSK